MTKRKKKRSTNICQWCGLEFPNATEHMVHVTNDHPEAIGRGRTMSKGWSCLNDDCAGVNPPVIHNCLVCGRSNPGVWAANKLRRFVIVRKLPDGITLSRSKEMSYRVARESIPHIPAIIDQVARGGAASAIYSDPVVFDPARYECWAGNRRIAWLEVATVTATPNHQPTRSHP